MTGTALEGQQSMLRSRRAGWPIRSVSVLTALIATSAGLGAVAQNAFVATRTKTVIVKSVPLTPNTEAASVPDADAEAPAARCLSIHPPKDVTVQYRSPVTHCATLLGLVETTMPG